MIQPLENDLHLEWDNNAQKAVEKCEKSRSAGNLPRDLQEYLDFLENKVPKDVDRRQINTVNTQFRL